MRIYEFGTKLLYHLKSTNLYNSYFKSTIENYLGTDKFKENISTNIQILVWSPPPPSKPQYFPLFILKNVKIRKCIPST